MRSSVHRTPSASFTWTINDECDWRSIVADGAQQQQVHLDLQADDLDEAGHRATDLGARLLQTRRRPADNPDGDEAFAVYASPAGHPFCLGSH